MFFYATSNRFTGNLKIQPFSDTKNPKWLEQIAKWVEDKWGYIRGFPGLEYRKDAISTIQDHFYVITYGKPPQPVGMFALFDYHSFSSKINAKELMYVYLEESFRGLGIGKRIIESAKKISESQGASMVVLDTLNPNLNHFYEKCGAKVICDGQLLKHPTSVLRI